MVVCVRLPMRIVDSPGTAAMGDQLFNTGGGCNNSMTCKLILCFLSEFSCSLVSGQTMQFN